MTVEALEKELKEGKLKEIYLFYGEETYLMDTCVKKIRTLFGEAIKGINYIEIDDTNLEKLISDLQTPSFGYPKKLVIVKNTGLFKREVKKKGANFADLRDKICAYLKESSDIIKQDNIVVFVEESVDKGKMLTCLEEIGADICNFEYQKLPNIVARLKAICKAYNVNIDDATLKYFIECVRK
jgi:DNA polymerase-3 subunit delta